MTDTFTVRVARKVAEAQDICSFELVPTSADTLPPFSAGAHLDVQVPGGWVRQYSLCNDPVETHRYQIGVLRDAASRGGSVAMHDQVQEGQTLTIGAPKNRFALDPRAERSLLLAGGIGVTPLLGMAHALSRAGADFTLHYCTRSVGRTAFRERILASDFADRVRFHHDDGPADQALPLEALLARPQPGTHLYVCGPQGFLEAVRGAARRHGWPDGQVHFESFGVEATAHTGDTAFDVELSRSGRLVRVAADQTIVQALAQAGVTVPTSCEQGVCGTCLTRVLDGVPDHRDLYLTPEELAANDQMLPCCSRATSARLVLDL